MNQKFKRAVITTFSVINVCLSAMTTDSRKPHIYMKDNHTTIIYRWNNCMKAADASSLEAHYRKEIKYKMAFLTIKQ